MAARPAPIVAFAGEPSQRDAYRAGLTREAKAVGLALDLEMDASAVEPARVDYLIFADCGVVTDFAPFTRLKAILNLWAGVEQLMRREPPAEVPVVRMVEEGLTLGMIDYVSAHVLRHHVDVDRYIAAAPIAEWEKDYPPLARNRKVGILGLGALGSACARVLMQIGFRVCGWARSPKSLPGVACHHGAEGLQAVLEASEILVLLLPHTDATYRLIDADALARMPPGACIVNAGRGALIDHEALLCALDSGHIRHATMDVFDQEPLPPDHPYWRHPRATVTPHIASVTRPETASRALVESIRRAEAGEPFVNVVDRARGY